MKPAMATAATARGNHQGPTFELSRQEDRRDDEERREDEEGNGKSQVPRPHPHPFAVQHAERTQFLIHGRLEVAEPSQDAVARLRQGDGILCLALVLKGKIEDGRILGREGRV